MSALDQYLQFMDSLHKIKKLFLVFSVTLKVKYFYQETKKSILDQVC